MAAATRAPIPYRRLLVLIATALVAGASWVAYSATRGETAPLPTLDQLQCTVGSLRSTMEADYSEDPSGDTPEIIATRYVASGEGSVRRLDPRTIRYRFNNTVRAQADRAIVTVDSPIGSPSMVFDLYQADNGDWRIDSLANCEQGSTVQKQRDRLDTRAG